MFKIATCALALVSLTVPAFPSFGLSQAQAAPVDKIGEYGGWNLYIDNTIGDSCFIGAAFEGGTVLRLGFDMKNGGGYLLFGNADWKSVEVGKAYDIEVQFTGETPWNANAETVKLGETNFLVLRFDDAKFITEFMERTAVTLRYESKQIDKLSLSGTAIAGKALLSCQQVMNERKSEKKDPFAGKPAPKSAPAKVDPFSTI